MAAERRPPVPVLPNGRAEALGAETRIVGPRASPSACVGRCVPATWPASQPRPILISTTQRNGFLGRALDSTRPPRIFHVQATGDLADLHFLVRGNRACPAAGPEVR